MQAPMTKRFAWSWSKYKNYVQCPKRNYHVDIVKDYVEDQSDALTWGNQVHDAMAKRIARGTPLPPTMARYDDWPRRIMALKNAGLDVTVENKMAMDEQFRPTSFFDASTWFRCVVDVKVLMLQHRAALTIDWKTGGNIQPEFEQLALSAQVMFVHYPDLDEVASIYVWLGHDTQSVKVYKRSDLATVWGSVLPTVRKMEFAHQTLTYEPKPSGLCKRYCPVTSCVYHGRGTQ